jgi:hypothetical protein
VTESSSQSYWRLQSMSPGLVSLIKTKFLLTFILFYFFRQKNSFSRHCLIENKIMKILVTFSFCLFASFIVILNVFLQFYHFFVTYWIFFLRKLETEMLITIHQTIFAGRLYYLQTVNSNDEWHVRTYLCTKTREKKNNFHI